MDLYRDNILDHYQNPRNFGKLNDSTATGSVENELCGDSITFYLKLHESKKEVDKKSIDAISFEGQGCALSMASASLLSELAQGKTVSELKRLGSDDMVNLLGVSPTPTRLKCALTPLEALQKALVNYE